MSSDQELKIDVENELRWDPAVDESNIGVIVRHGIVTLMGHISTYAEKHAAGYAARKVRGVRAVANELAVQLSVGSARNDEEIAMACVHALCVHALVPHLQIQVVVDKGWVTLSGEVAWQYQKAAAEEAVRNLVGVVGITEEIQLKPPLTSTAITEQIVAAFKRHAEIDAHRITVEALDGKVKLSGDVRSLAEKEQAQQAAFAAPGVNEVENNLVVSP